MFDKLRSYVRACVGRRRDGLPRLSAATSTRFRLERLEERVNPSAVNSQYVDQLYRDVLHRTVDSVGASIWVGQLDSGIPIQTVVGEILKSAEYKAIEINADHQKLLSRNVDGVGLGLFLPVLQGAGTNENVLAIIAGSQEYFANRASSSNAAFPNALARDLFQKPLDASTLAASQLALAGGASRTQVASTLLAKPDYATAVVTDAYLTYLGRSLDASGNQYWTSRFLAGQSGEQIRAGILSSGEYYTRTQKSGGVAETAGATPSSDEVRRLLDRAAAATPSTDGIIAITDRGGRILGVRAEGGLDAAILGSVEKMVFAVDGAVALARTGAFFGNNQAPLTSRTVQFISQTTMTQREIDSDPGAADPTVQGPGFVAPIGIKNHFPPDVPFTPQVDLFAIEHTNRDTTFHPTAGGPVQLAERFNVNPAFIPASIPIDRRLAAPDSYGFASGVAPTAQPRGIGTLPGGIPIFKRDPATGRPVVVGGIGVFYPGKTGFASEENSSLNSNFNPAKPDRTLEAEFAAFAALGGAPLLDGKYAVGTLAGIDPVPGVVIPITPDQRRIDLVGITLDIIGPGGLQGPQNLLDYATANLAPGTGTVTGAILPLINPGADNNLGTPGDLPAAAITLPGTPVPEGFLVAPHASKFTGGLTAAEVQQMIQQGVNQALQTRAAIRLPMNQHTVMVFSVADKDGEILGLFHMPDSTVFSIDVAVSKSRNVNYISDAAQVQPQDLGGVPAGTAISSRTIRYLALPRFPEGIDGAPAGPFSILNDGGTDPNTALTVGARLPASAFQSVQGYDAFHPQTNFRDPTNPLNQSGVVFFPGAVPVYKNGLLAGGLGISGDGVDQDDVVTFAAKQGFDTPANVVRADEVFIRGIRLPYQKFNRVPQL